ncbi:MAG: ion transporter [Bacteroidales bacterium]|nr:ion transporter [Bacteroidales bacterium]MCF8344816.1 ion transporter [Bacteroidales bacterium]MCF8352386.1 ion transporter [Bacteroidales bacterium]MCF8376023.1 ion transporter [Bacteroidales bacterium]MCF8402180.1 ion transporter [Bacteroidales bacterium]
MPKEKSWKRKLHIVIFGSNTRLGRLFDIILLISIILSVLVVFLDSVEKYHILYGTELYIAEWFFTVLFSIEYTLRIISVRHKWKYIFSFYGIIDFLAISPTYISLLVAGTQFLLVIRILRLLRVFRILKLDRFIGASGYLMESLKSSKHKILVFLSTVLSIVVIMGALMYLIEGPENGFSSIPKSIYWAIVTLTTVGYGDIAPQTFWGQAMASVIMIMGYSIIAVPTGIITVEMARQKESNTNGIVCSYCGQSGHHENAHYCHHCGEKL